MIHPSPVSSYLAKRLVKEKDYMLPCICAISGKNKKWYSTRRRVCHWFFIFIAKLTVTNFGFRTMWRIMQSKRRPNSLHHAKAEFNYRFIANSSYFYLLSISPARRLYPSIYQMLQILLLKGTCYPSKKYVTAFLRSFGLRIAVNAPFFNQISITSTYFCSINSQGALRNEVNRWCSVYSCIFQMW